MADSDVRRTVAPERLRDPGYAEATVYQIQHYDGTWRKEWVFSNTDLFGRELTKPIHECWQVTGVNGFLNKNTALKTLRKLKMMLRNGTAPKDTRGRIYFEGTKQWRVVKVTTRVEIEVIRR